MFFKNLQVFRTTKQWSIDASDLEFSLIDHAHVPVTPAQAESHGWAHVHESQFVRNIDGQLLLAFKSEVKRIPSTALKAALAAKIAAIVDTTGRKPGKKETRELKEECVFDLLPRTLPTESITHVWIDTKAGWIVINTPSKAKSDRIITSLVRALESLQLETLHLAKDPGTLMAQWLSENETDAAFSIDRECELRACDESKATVKYAKENLDTDDIRTHIKQGKRVTKLALTWNDRVSFVLTDDFKLRKLVFLEGVFEGQSDDNEDQQRADMMIMTGELRFMLSELIVAFGGVKAREET